MGPGKLLWLGILGLLPANISITLFDKMRIGDPVGYISVHGFDSLRDKFSRGCFLLQNAMSYIANRPDSARMIFYLLAIYTFSKSIKDCI